MNIIQLIRLILDNLKLVLTVPVVLVVLVYFLLKDSPKKYQSKTIIYTGIGTGYNIASVNGSRFDFLKNKTDFDNLINVIESRKTYEEVGLRLLAKHLALKEPYPETISKQHYIELRKSFPDSLYQLLVDTSSYENTYQNLERYAHSNEKNYIYDLLNLTHPYYSVRAISGIQVKRISNSDIIEINYTCDDPGVCQQTLILLNEVFVRNYKIIKKSETSNVVGYFQRQLKKSKDKLNVAEKKLLDFNKNNKIINYYEQTKHIAKYREDIDLLYQEELMEKVAAKASIEKTEQQLDSRNRLLLMNSDIINKRKKLADISCQIALLEINKDSINSEKLDNLYTIQNKLEADMNNRIKGLGFIENSVSGLSQKDISQTWMQAVIDYEKSKARLLIYEDKLKELDNVYARYAPLGATIKRIEREINVTEREYLTILKGLNDAKIMQKNIEMSTNLNVIDKPYFPVVPEPSKTKLLIIASGLIGFILMVFIIIVIEYFDTTIKSHEKLHQITGLPVAGAIPNLFKKNKKVDYDYVVNRSFSRITQNIRTEAFRNKKDRNAPFITILFSTQNDDGKTLVAEYLQKSFAESNFNVVSFNYLLEGDNKTENGYYYNFKDLFLNDFNLQNFFKKLHKGDCDDIDFVFIEIPSILHNPIPIRLVLQADNAIMIARSNRAWVKAETIVLDDFKKLVDGQTTISCVANGVEVNTLESLIGEIPKKRSLVRVFIKKLIKFQFTASKKL